MGAHWWWWGLAVALAACELASGTLYLLVLALGAAAGGASAFFGLGATWQALNTALVALLGWLILRRVQPRRRGAMPPVQANHDVHMDIGTRLRVEHWQPGGTARVHYRGAAWDAVIQPGQAGFPEPGEYEIRAIEGNRLVLAPAP